MGTGYSNFDEKSIVPWVTAEFEKTQQNKKSRAYLVLSDLFYGGVLHELPEDYTINMCHLGSLFMLDGDKDGRISLEDMLQFSTMSVKTIK